MKRIFTLLVTSMSVTLAGYSQQLLVDDFNYSGYLTDNGWSITGTNVTDPIQTTTGLTYAGYPGSGVGNAANVVGANQDVNRGFTNQTGNGTNIFMTALVRVTDAAANTGGYFLHLGDRSDTDPTSFTSFSARVFAKTDATGIVNFGISNSSTATFGTTNFTTNTTYLIVVKYTINILGGDNVSLWVLSSGVPVDEASLGTPEATNAATGQDNIDAVGIRQAASIPDVILDGLRITNTLESALPLNLTSFRGFSNGNNSVSLTWTSANEQNVKSFTIERSMDGRTFAPVGEVAANNSAQASYTFTDPKPVGGVNYYRLVMTDKDGSVKYSAVVTVNNRKGLAVSVFPNPTFGNLILSHTKASKGAVVRIFNSEGRQVKTSVVENGASQTKLAVSELAAGNYIVVFENDGEKTTGKFVKQ